MALAYGTELRVPDGVVAIERISPAERLLASGLPLQWVDDGVAFSHGTGPGGVEPNMVVLRWADGEIKATRDHVFALHGGGFRQAIDLIPGQSVLLAADGSPVSLVALEIGLYRGGVQSVATDTPWRSDSLAGRLLITQGIVTGDFQLQIHFQPGDEPAIDPPGHAARPGPATSL